MHAAFLAAAILAADPSWLVQFAESWNAEKLTTELAQAKKMGLRRGKVTTGYASLDEKKQAVADAEYHLAVAKKLAAGVSEVPLLPGQRDNLPVKGLKVGDVGRFSGSIRGTSNDIGLAKVVQVVSERSAIVELMNQGARADYWIWVDMDTRGWTDGKWIHIDKPVRILEPKSYESVLGARKTIPHVVAWSVEEIDAFWRLVRKK